VPCPAATVPVPVLGLVDAVPLDCAKLIDAIRARANVMLRSFFTVFFSSGGTEINPSDAVTAAIVVKNPYFYHRPAK
jgi:hypothetical protein